ncbi:MAG TPA: signal peptidase I [Candidatus Paceibacterota bacterium]|nr:signal peptidase I [Candidatus Paceibacterota bacterium]
MENEKNLKAEEKVESTGRSLWELARFALLAIAIVVPIRIFIAQPFVVSGSSMFPTFEDKQYLIVDEISYKLGNINRGDVVIFKYPLDTKKYYIKRIIGLPNEIVDIKNGKVTITNEENPEGFEIDDSFIKNISKDIGHYELQDDEYFVLGDNRTNSSDSRFWGPVPKKLLVGRAFLRLLPISKVSVFPGEHTLLN